MATADLDTAATRLEAEYGLRSEVGGRHAGLGTHNRIVPLGGGYLELLAVADPDEAAASGMGRALLAAIEGNAERFIGWSVAVHDVEAVAARLEKPVNTIERDGLSARLTGVPESMADPSRPFFIERDPGIEDPGATGEAGGITAIEVAGDADRLESWLGPNELPLTVVEGPPAVRAIEIGPQGRLRISFS